MAVMVLAMRPHFLYRSATVNLAVARDVEMVTDVTEATVVDMVVAAGFKVQVSPSGVAEQWMMISVILRIPAD